LSQKSLRHLLDIVHIMTKRTGEVTAGQKWKQSCNTGQSECQVVIFRENSWKQAGVRTLRTQDTSDPRHFGTMCLVPKCLRFFQWTLRHQCRNG